MARMTGGEALVKTLRREGTRVVFGLPGVQLYGVMAALREEKAVRFIATRHEQAIGYMADGYARAGGGYGVGLVVPGPGLLNTTAGLSTAYAASSPVLMISGQVPRANIGRDVGVLHEVNDQLDAIAPVTKWRKRVVEIRDVPEAVQDAVRQLKTGRPRPVEIELPPETMEDEAEVELLDPLLVVRAGASAHDVERAVSLLLASSRPVIYAGGGVHGAGAHQAVADVAEYLQAGVVPSARGQGARRGHQHPSLAAALYPPNPPQKNPPEAGVRRAADPGAAGVDHAIAPQRRSRGRHRRGGHDADRLLHPALLARVSATHVPDVVLFGQPRLRLPDGARREGRLPRPSGRRHLGGRWVPLQRAGAGDRGAVRHQRDRARLQRQRVRQRGARPRRGLGRQLRRRAHEPRFHEAGRRLRRGRDAGRYPDRRGRARHEGAHARAAGSDRNPGGPDAEARVLSAAAQADAQLIETRSSSIGGGRHADKRAKLRRGRGLGAASVRLRAPRRRGRGGGR